MLLLILYFNKICTSNVHEDSIMNHSNCATFNTAKAPRDPKDNVQILQSTAQDHLSPSPEPLAEASGISTTGNWDVTGNAPVFSTVFWMFIPYNNHLNLLWDWLVFGLKIPTSSAEAARGRSRSPSSGPFVANPAMGFHQNQGGAVDER